MLLWLWYPEEESVWRNHFCLPATKYYRGSAAVLSTWPVKNIDSLTHQSFISTVLTRRSTESRERKPLLPLVGTGIHPYSSQREMVICLQRKVTDSKTSNKPAANDCFTEKHPFPFFKNTLQLCSNVPKYYSL